MSQKKVVAAVNMVFVELDLSFVIAKDALITETNNL